MSKTSEWYTPTKKELAAAEERAMNAALSMLDYNKLMRTAKHDREGLIRHLLLAFHAAAKAVDLFRTDLGYRKRKSVAPLFVDVNHIIGSALAQRLMVQSYDEDQRPFPPYSSAGGTLQAYAAAVLMLRTAERLADELQLSLEDDAVSDAEHAAITLNRFDMRVAADKARAERQEVAKED